MLFDAFQDSTVARKVRGSPATLSDSFFLCLFFFFSAFGFAVGKSTDGRMRSRLPLFFKLCVLVLWSFVCLNLVP